MKKILLITAATLAMSISSFGATFSQDCTNTANSVAGAAVASNENVSCPSFGVVPAGFQITSVSISVLSSFNGNGTVSTPNDGQLQINITYDPAVGTPNTASCNLDATTTTTSLLCSNVFTDTPVAGTTSYAAFLVNVSFLKGIDANNVYGGQASGAVGVTYTYTLIPSTNGVPEPTTVALMGAGLVALATAARRRRS